jgi:hypothetical protein
MVSTRPNAAAYARVSYGRELRGDVNGAAEAMQMARQATTVIGQGKVKVARGDRDGALAIYRRATEAHANARVVLHAARIREASAHQNRRD